MKRLYGTNEQWRDIAVTVACPQCGAPPRRGCTGPECINGTVPTTHVGRLKAAVPEPRDDTWWWLAEHDALLAGVR